jgi:spermidine synthase
VAKTAKLSRQERRRAELVERRTVRRVRSHRNWVVGALAMAFLFSGAAGLIHEVVWVRLLGFVFGVSELAMATVLAAFMGGLALGSWLVGTRSARIADRRRTYAWLEIGIGVAALVLPLLFWALEPVYGAIWRRVHLSFAVFSVIRFVLAGSVLLLPTIMMGATLPVLADHLARVEGGRVAPETLYTLNLVGAVLGVALGGFVLMPGIGLWGTMMVGALLNVGVGVAVLLLPATVEHAAPELVPSSPAASAPRLIVLAAFLSGALSLATQVAWTRVLTLVIGSTTYAFTSVLLVYLLALGLGSAWAAWRGARGGAVVTDLALVHLVGALGLVAAVWSVNRLPFWYLRLYGLWGPAADLGGVARGLVLAAMILFVPVVAAGTVLPLALVGAVPRGGSATGAAVGRLYATNTLGAILGAMIVGFVLIPVVGTKTTLLGVASIAAAMGIAFVTAGPRPRWLAPLGAAAAILVAAGVALAPPWNYQDLHTGVAEPLGGQSGAALAQIDALTDTREKLLFQREGATASVLVREDPQKTRKLVINSRTNASDDASDMATQVLLAQLPFLFAPHTERVFVVGWGSGVTVGSAAHTATGRVTAVELEPAVVEASAFFQHVNLDPLRNPRVRLFEDDARHILVASDETWDVVINEPSHPWVAGIANLFTRDYYGLVARRLEPDGVLATWLQTYQVATDTYRSLLGTLLSVFPEVLLFHSPGTSDTILLAARQPFVVDLAELDRRFAAGETRAELARVGVEGPEHVLAMLYLGTDAAKRYAAGAPLNTDDNMYVEFRGPRDRERAATGDLGSVLGELDSRAPPSETLLRDPQALLGDPKRLKSLIAGLRRVARETARYEALLTGR